MQLPHPHRNVGPRILNVMEEVGHALLPPSDARVIQRNLGAELVRAVLTAKEGEIPYCVPKVRKAKGKEARRERTTRVERDERGREPQLIGMDLEQLVDALLRQSWRVPIRLMTKVILVVLDVLISSLLLFKLERDSPSHT